MKTSPLISVVVPAFNAGRHIRRCVDSILAQTHENLEVLVVNDASTDSTARVLDELAVWDGRVRVENLRENVGVHTARAIGVRNARGESIGFVDSDDSIAPEMYADLLAEAQRTEAEIVICGAMSVPPGDEVGEAKVAFGERRVFDDDVLGRFCRLEFGSGVLWNKLYQAELLRRFAGLPFGSHLGEDYVVNFGCFAAASRVVTVPELHYRYTIRPESASRRRSNAEQFVQTVQAYVACLETYHDAMPQQVPLIDVLFTQQLRFDCYAVSEFGELAEWNDTLRDCLVRLSEVHPAGVYALIHTFDRPRAKPTEAQGPVSSAARNFVRSGRALGRAVVSSIQPRSR